MIDLVKHVEEKYLSLSKNLPAFRPGDTIKVWIKIQEGDKERLQLFEGVCIRRRKGGTGASFTVRKVSYGIGVERIFPINSPMIDRIEVIQRGKVRRSRLYYLRKLRGKAARVKVKGREFRAPAVATPGGEKSAASADNTRSSS
jgi:large subunit ribosomal protein L19